MEVGGNIPGLGSIQPPCHTEGQVLQWTRSELETVAGNHPVNHVSVQRLNGKATIKSDGAAFRGACSLLGELNVSNKPDLINTQLLGNLGSFGDLLHKEGFDGVTSTPTLWGPAIASLQNFPYAKETRFIVSSPPVEPKPAIPRDLDSQVLWGRQQTANRTSISETFPLKGKKKRT